MAIGVVFEFTGTLDQYDSVCAKMGFTPGGKGAPGGLFHWVTKTDNGFRVTDVWEDEETYGKFAETQIGPYAAEFGLAEPVITIYPVHNYLFAG